MSARILMIVDVPGWAWDIKAQQVKRFLSNEFYIDIFYTVQEGKLDKDIAKKYDLFFTFAPRYVDMLEARDVPIGKRVTGVTAHFLNIEKDLETRRNKVKYVHANSLLLMDVVRKYYSDVFYLPNGVDPTRFFPIERMRMRDRPFTVGHVGKAAPRKGFDSIIRPAFDDACKKGEMVLKANRRRYYDAIPHVEMNEWYQDVDIMVFASDLDGTPNSMLEAGLIGIPTIINWIGNAPELIVDGFNGFLMETMGVSIYAEKIAWCRYNTSEVKRMGRNMREIILDKWTWQTQVENYREMFRRILG